MLYRTEQAFDGVQQLNDANESHHFKFNLDRDVDNNYPGIIIIRATGVDYHKNRVSLNDNFIGYLTSGKKSHFFEIDNRIYGALRKTGNTIAVLTCDIWGDRKSVSGLNIDDLAITNIDVAYKPR
ncbi:hypothetical protein [Desulfonema magnum]|uniref:Uncharacterized protein n=1 Tax=Desulfonema magnum TaxID=45655 RepID=A0A975BFI5_9BACT|nr:hypothetical protein [Desulfonema magnum]QTA84249.1 Uncharacterized protein dnm_002430 [Desulfonema magnum]